MTNKPIEEILMALSLANLLFIKSWRRLIYPASESYHIKLEPTALDYLSLFFSIVLTTVVFVSVIWISRRLTDGATPRIIKLVFIILVAIVLNGLRLQLFNIEIGLNLEFALFALALLMGIFLVIKWKSQFFRFTKALLIIVSPFVLITFSQSLIIFFKSHPQPEPKLAAQLSALQAKENPGIRNRVIWIIFDELDYVVPFGTNPPKIDLPQLQRLRNESLFATNAASPDPATIVSIPSLLTGKKVKESVTSGKKELILKFDDRSTAKMSQIPNIFSNVKALNGHTAVVGWYHPYCRVMGQDLSACQWESIDTVNDFEDQTFLNKMGKHFINCFDSLPLVSQLSSAFELRFQGRAGYLKRHHDLLEGTGSVVSNPSIDLAFIHLPFPHSPNFFDRKANSFKAPGEIDSLSGYADNLILTDRVLGEIRQRMEAAELWDNSTVIVSSDHQWRVKRWKNSLSFTKEDLEISEGVEHSQVPFFLKLKGQKESLTYEKPFNTIITHDLILAIMKGEISTAEDAVSWLDQAGRP